MPNLPRVGMIGRSSRSSRAPAFRNVLRPESPGERSMLPSEVAMIECVADAETR
jgi:hypothetical protein